MKAHTIFIISAVLLSSTVLGQQSGNSVYGQNLNSSDGKSPTVDKLFLTDSTFIIQANVMMNVIADNYVATFGVNESSTTLTDCNEKIEKRIQSFIADLSKLGIALIHIR